MTPLTLSAVLAAPMLFPDLSPLAVWFGLGCLALCWWVWAKADDALGDCESSLRAMEARDWLVKMNPVRGG